MLDSNKYKKKKKRLQNKQKQKLQEEKQKLKEILKRDEKSLAGLRVVQKNLVFVIGIQQRTHDELRREFSKFGKIHKLVIGNTNNTNLNTAYITFQRPEDAIKTIQALNQGCTNSLNSQLILNGHNKLINGRSTLVNGRPTQGILKASLGTTKYCNHWLKNQQCPKLPDCMYLHELAEQEASFTKEDMQKGKHADYEKKLIQEYSEKYDKSNDCDEENNLKNGDDNEEDHSNDNDDQLSNQMTLNGDEEDNLLFSNLGLNKFGKTIDSSTANEFENRATNVSQLNCVNNKKSLTGEDDKETDKSSMLLFGKLDKLDNHQTAHLNNDNSDLNNKQILNLSCIKPPSNFLDAQQLLKIDDSHNSITSSSNNLNNSSNNSNGLSSINTTTIMTNSVDKSKCINNNSNNRLKMNLIDEIIANSSDSSTSYSTCSSGSNGLNTGDLNDFNNLLQLNGVERLKITNQNDNDLKPPHLQQQISPIGNSNNLINYQEDDGLDFDPFSVSRIGLQDLLKTSTMNTTNGLNCLNQNTMTNRIMNNNQLAQNNFNQFLFGHPQQQQQQPTSPFNQLNQLNQLSQLNQLNQLNPTINQTNLNVLHHNQLNQAQQQTKSNLFGNLNGNLNDNMVSSINCISPIGGLQQQSQPQQQQTQLHSNNPNDALRNSLRALLPNVNITFANSSSANQSSLNNLNNMNNNNNNQNNQNLNQNLFFKQQQMSQIAQQEPIKTPPNLTTQTIGNFSMQQTPANAVKNNQNFINQLQQQTVFPQAQLAFLQHQQQLRQHAVASGLNLPFANANFFNQQPNLNKQPQIPPNLASQSNLNGLNQTGQLSHPNGLNNLGNLNGLQRFFPFQDNNQNDLVNRPPGF